MNQAEQFLFSLDQSWAAFTHSRKKAQAKASEKSIHALRVSTRRLIAVLELTRALSKDNGISKPRRRLKKLLKALGPLRDAQVQLQKVKQLPQSGPLNDFRKYLQRREKRELAADLKRGPSRRSMDRARAELVRLCESSRANRMDKAVERVIRVRRNAFARMRRQFKPEDEQTLHRMRIALKKVRYLIEAAEPVLGPAAVQQAREMRALQQLLGDARDLQLLRVRLADWASKRGVTLAAAPALEFLREQRDALMHKLEEACTDPIAFPAVERTIATTPILATPHPSAGMTADIRKT